MSLFGLISSARGISICRPAPTKLVQLKKQSRGRAYKAGFQVLTAPTMKVTVFWNVALCTLVVPEQCLRDAYCHHHQGDEYHLLSSP
jgi:hypothetical protein